MLAPFVTKFLTFFRYLTRVKRFAYHICKECVDSGKLVSVRHVPTPSYRKTDELVDFNSESTDEVAIVTSNGEDFASQESLNRDKINVSTSQRLLSKHKLT